MNVEFISDGKEIVTLSSLKLGDVFRLSGHEMYMVIKTPDEEYYNIKVLCVNTQKGLFLSPGTMVELPKTCHLVVGF